MKKTVKGLIIAASVAAVVGVSAVSFAAWSGGSADDATVTGTTGEIVVISGAISASDNLAGKKLVPYDQADQYDATKMAKEMTITLTADAGLSGAVLKMQASADDAGAKLEYQKADETWASFTTAVEVSAGTIKVRLNSNTTDDMKQGYTITFSAEQPAVESGS